MYYIQVITWASENSFVPSTASGGTAPLMASTMTAAGFSARRSAFTAWYKFSKVGFAVLYIIYIIGR
jgi:hypothetical protein